MSEHAEHMNRALDIAYDRMGRTSPNPPVGAVIVKNGAVISAAGTGEYGSSHAERLALEGAGGEAGGAHMYVSLEPCCHHGKTPPCTDAIISAGISRVFIPLKDPNPLVAGGGIRALEQAGIEVSVLREWTAPAFDLLRPFAKSILKRRPFVLHKSAMTLDGRIATEGGDSKWISSDYSRFLVHRLRSKVDAIIVGKNTFLADDPSLDVRIGSFDPAVRGHFTGNPPELQGRGNGFLDRLLARESHEPRNPLRVVVGVPETLDLTCKIFSDDRYLLMDSRERVEGVHCTRGNERVEPDPGHLIALESRDRPGMIIEILEELRRRGVMFAMVEGGGRLAGSFHDAGEIDQYLYFISPKIAGNGRPVLHGNGARTIADALTLGDVTRFAAGADLVWSGYRSAVQTA